MKKCTYCGKEFPDTASVCDLDGRPLADPGAPDSSSQTPRSSEVSLPLPWIRFSIRRVKKGTPRPPKEYQRLPGRGNQVEGNRWIAVTRSLSTAWMARDHLLLISRSGFTEHYKRFYFRDIQAIIIRKTAASLVGNIVLMVLALACFLLTAAVSDPAARIVWALIGGFFAFFAAWSLWLGSTCVTHIKTAVQTEQLAAWSRMRAARKGMALLRPRLLEAQGELPEVELKARLEEQILRQTQPSATETT
jgi:hypothetical protein